MWEPNRGIYGGDDKTVTLLDKNPNLKYIYMKKNIKNNINIFKRRNLCYYLFIYLFKYTRFELNCVIVFGRREVWINFDTYRY